jgi:hypothetical protein
MTWLLPALAAVLYTIRATPLSRLRFWWSWSPLYVVCSLTITVIVLYVNSVLGLLAVSRGMTARVDWTGSLAAALAAPAVTRKGTGIGSSRGSTLALGTLSDVQSWFKALLADAIEKWADNLTDDELDAAAAVIDRKKKGSRPPSTVRAQLRDDRRDDMKVGGTVREETRADLIEAVKSGYITFEVPRPR